MGIITRVIHLWSTNEIKLLKKLYPTENTQKIADKLGLSTQQVRNKAHLIGLNKTGKTTARVWSRQEEILLRKMYPDNIVSDIAKQLGCTVTLVQAKVQKLGLRKARAACWSKIELNLLRKLYPSKTALQIANQIGRTVLATRLKIVRLGLKKRYKTEK